MGKGGSTVENNWSFPATKPMSGDVGPRSPGGPKKKLQRSVRFVDNKRHSGFGFENNPNFGHFLMKPAYKPRLFRTPNAAARPMSQGRLAWFVEKSRNVL